MVRPIRVTRTPPLPPDRRRGRKQQFVIVAAMPARARARPSFSPAQPAPAESLRFDLRAHVALLANMFKVGGKAVAHIDHRRSKSALPQPLAQRPPVPSDENAGILRSHRLRFRQPRQERRRPANSRSLNLLAGFAPTAAPPFPLAPSPPPRCPLESTRRLRCIPPPANPEFFRQIQQPFRKRSTHFCGTSLATASDKKCRQQLSTHRRDIAQPACQAAPSHQLWTVPVAPEVHLLDGEIGGYQ